MIHKIKNIQDLVKRILEHQPETRDNDRLLMIRVWCHQNPQLKTGSVDMPPVSSFFIDFRHGRYADPESIRRARQKWQEKFPQLRGQAYYERSLNQKKTRQGILDL